MKRSFSISQKIWFSLSILILGYFFSMTLGFFLGKHMESRLIHVSYSHFPASQQGQKALTAFKEQISLYQNAVLFGDLSLIESAKTKADEIKVLLQNILEFKDLEALFLNETREILKLLDSFTPSAQTVYTKMSLMSVNVDIDDSITEDARILAIRSEDIRDRLNILADTLSEGLKTELTDINDMSKRQRYLNLFMFLSVVFIALTLISIILARSVTGPLKKTLMLEKAIEQSVDGIVVVDLKGYIIFVNQAWAEMHGYITDELVGKTWKLFHTTGQLHNEVKPFNKIVKEEGSNKGEIGHMRKDGTVFPTAMTSTDMTDEKGEPIGVITTARDITIQKKNEEALEKAKTEAENANKVKSEFLANMSHEIRTPLNGVMGVLNLLLSTGLDNEQLNLVETGKRSSDSLLTVINDILDFSKIEAGELDLEIIDFNLPNSIAEILELPAMQAHQKGVEFVYEIHHEIPALLMGDPGRLRQILLNLTNNAIKFTERGEVIVRVLPEDETETHSRIIFKVQDTGIGIPKDKLGDIFESFRQSDSSTTRMYGGTGLGLSISKKLAELMKGEIGVVSEMGRGSVFWFTALFEKQPHAKITIPTPPPDVKGKRLLLVDDNRTNLEILSSYMESWDFSYDIAHSGEMALSLMNAVSKVDAPFDAVVLDMQMPGMDGIELGKLIKSDPLLKNTKMIMLTSLGLRGEASRIKKIGFEAYLTKPVRRSQLFDCLISVLGKGPEETPDKKPMFVTKYTLSEENRKKIRILLVEDNIVNQKLALRIIQNFGFQADAAANGKEALKALESFKYDLVLMDVQMPEMDGLEATKRIRDPRSKVIDHDIPIIAMTAHAMKEDRTRCINAGMNDYITKPIENQKLLEAIEKATSP